MATATAANPKSKYPRLANVLEYAAIGPASKIDREAGVVSHVKILGFESRHNYTYSKPAVASARDLYEGTRVFIAHDPKAAMGQDRDPRDQFGWLEKVVLESDGLYGDLHYIRSHPDAPWILEWIERSPEKLGFSHDAVVRESFQDGKVVIEAINCVRSVDLVCKPATTRGIFESEGKGKMDETQGTLPPAANAIEQEPLAPAAEPAAGDAGLQRLIDEIKTIVGGEGDAKTKAKQIGKVAKTLLDLEEKIEAAKGGGKSVPPAADEGEGEGAVTEGGGKPCKESAPSPPASDWAGAMNVLESVGVAPTAIRVRALLAVGESDRKPLAETWKGVPVGAGAKPKSVPQNVLESEQQGAAKPAAEKTGWDDPKVAASRLRGSQQRIG